MTGTEEQSKRPSTYTGKSSLDRHIGLELPPVKLQLVSHDVSHDTTVNFSSLKEDMRYEIYKNKVF